MMSTHPLRPAAAPLRLIALRVMQPELTTVAAQPTVIEAYRLTIRYHDGRHPDQVGTLVRVRGSAEGHLAVTYRRPNAKPLTLETTIDTIRAGALTTTLRQLHFDSLDDAKNSSLVGADTWLLERASGTFHHDVILTPETAHAVYADIVAAVQTHLREAVRTINL